MLLNNFYFKNFKINHKINELSRMTLICNIFKAELIYISITSTMRSLFHQHFITKKIQAFYVDAKIVDLSGSKFSKSDDNNNHLKFFL